MECGGNEFLCLFFSILQDNEFISDGIKELASHGGDLASKHGQALVGLAGLVFGIWRWWKYRERILHERLTQYLKENDWRLAQGQADVIEALQRPSPGQSFKLPLFATDELRSVLRERNWDRTPIAATIESSAQWQLSKAMEKIEHRLKSGEDMISSLRQQLATALILRGAIATATADRSTSASDDHLKALSAFRAAQVVPGHEQSLLAKELEAHQLRKLGRFSQALEEYQAVERIAATVSDYRSQRLTIARARRFQAEIRQVQASGVLPNGGRHFQGTHTAHNLLTSALSIRTNFAPFQGWELLEQGDIHYVTAFVAHIAEFTVREPQQLAEAKAAYEAVLSEIPHRLWGDRGTKRRRLLSQAGIDRVTRAEAGDYDWQWLVPG